MGPSASAKYPRLRWQSSAASAEALRRTSGSRYPLGAMADLFADYRKIAGYDEMFDGASVRPSYEALFRAFSQLDAAQYHELQEAADLETLNNGITFTVYSDDAGAERIFPFSLIPRVIEQDEWDRLDAGLRQRIAALNLFLRDAYTAHRCVTDGVVPLDLVLGHPAFIREIVDVVPPLGCFVHVAGCDLVRCDDGEFRLLEDNLRTPSGVSYVIENRRTMRSAVPEFFPAAGVASVDEHGDHLLESLVACRPAGVHAAECKVVVLTPGPYNSAYFEHIFLAREMGVELVEGRDLVVSDDQLFVRSTAGLERVHVVYRRVDDAFLDPTLFRQDSLMGVPGLIGAYRAGNVTIANALGAGVADDKAVFRYVPDLIRFYLGEEPLLEGVPTYLGRHPDDLEYILDNLRELVVKPTDGSGGYGVFIGPQANEDRTERMRRELRANPRHWIGQPLQRFSTVPAFEDGSFEPRRCDLRVFVVTGERSWVLPGGLTRVAPNSSSFIVNSSQGGGSKDSWVLRRPAEAG